jgi:outer membrane protein assembly factor BamB
MLTAADFIDERHQRQILLSNTLQTKPQLDTHFHVSPLDTYTPADSIRGQIPASQPPPSRSGAWLGWGADVYNNHWASTDATVSTANVGQLALHCAKHYDPTGVSAAPLVADGIAYYPTWTGELIALDYARCTEAWRLNISRAITQFQPLDPVQSAIGRQLLAARTTPALDGDVLYVGTLIHALLLAVDRRTGRLIDALQVHKHPFAVLTQSPTFYGGRVYVGASSLEESAAVLVAGYQCCSFVASMNAVELRHGRLRLVWTTPMIPVGLNFSGAAVWGSQPAIDPVRGQVFIATGNLYQVPELIERCQNQTRDLEVIKAGLTADPCLPRYVFQESVLALDLETGRVNWVQQLGPLDAWNLACDPGLLDGLPGLPVPGAEDQCPVPTGMDSDFGMAPTFVLGSKNTPDGLDIVVIGQKNGNLYALTAQAGTVLWVVSTGPSGAEGGLIWGIAVDDMAVYYTSVNSLRQNYTLPLSGGKTVISNSAFGAASLKDGRILWQTPAPHNDTSLVVPAVVNDVVLHGTTGSFQPDSFYPGAPGRFTPLDKHTGRILEDKTLDGYFHGAIATVHDYVMFGTGYGVKPAQAGSFQVWKIKEPVSKNPVVEEIGNLADKVVKLADEISNL